MKTTIIKCFTWYRIKVEPNQLYGRSDEKKQSLVKCCFDINDIQYFYEVAEEDRSDITVEETTLIFKPYGIKLDIALPIEKVEEIFNKHHEIQM